MLRRQPDATPLPSMTCFTSSTMVIAVLRGPSAVSSSLWLCEPLPYSEPQKSLAQVERSPTTPAVTLVDMGQVLSQSVASIVATRRPVCEAQCRWCHPGCAHGSATCCVMVATSKLCAFNAVAAYDHVDSVCYGMIISEAFTNHACTRGAVAIPPPTHREQQRRRQHQH